MKYLSIALFTFGITLIIIRQVFKRAEEKETLKPYTVTIIHGSSAIEYSATLQVDSLKYISNESVLVYIDKSSLLIKATYITFKKN